MTTKEMNNHLTVTSFDKTDMEFQMMGDFYKVFRAIYAVRDDDTYFAQAVSLLDEFYHKYEGNDIAEHFDDKFLTDLTGALGAFVERKTACIRNKEKESDVLER